MRHVFMVLDALGLQPADVFPLTYRPEPRSEVQQAKARRLLDTVLESYGQAPIPTPQQPETEADFDERVRLALGRLLGLKLPEPG